MGDMPEPKIMQSPQEKENTSFAKKLYGSLSKKFSGSKLAEELGEVRLGQVGGIERVGRHGGRVGERIEGLRGKSS